jgi:hypothetical protein
MAHCKHNGILIGYAAQKIPAATNVVYQEENTLYLHHSIEECHETQSIT